MKYVAILTIHKYIISRELSPSICSNPRGGWALRFIQTLACFKICNVNHRNGASNAWRNFLNVDSTSFFCVWLCWNAYLLEMWRVSILPCEPSDWCFKILDESFYVGYYILHSCLLISILFSIRNVMFFNRLYCEPSDWCFEQSFYVGYYALLFDYFDVLLNKKRHVFSIFVFIFFCFVWLFWCCILLDMLCFEKTVLWTIGLVFQNFG